MFDIYNIWGLAAYFLLTIASSFVIIPGITVWEILYAVSAPSIPILSLVILLIWVPSIIGDLSTYIFAKAVSKPVRKFLMRWKWYSKNERKTRKTLQKRGFMFVFLTRWLATGLSPVVNYLAGFEKMSFKKFALAVISGELLYAIIYSAMGYAFKDTWNYLLSAIESFSYFLVLLIIAIYIIYRIVKHIRRKKEEII